MIKQARSNATLYNEMLEAGYTDGEFPDWWFSPARGAKTAQVPGEDAEGAKVRKDTQKVEGEEGYDPTPPETPTPREGRPALQAQRSDPMRSDPIHAEHVSAVFSDAELSLLKDRGITEVTPGRWMHTAEQADGRIMLPPVDARQELLNIRREAQGERIWARVRNGTIPLFTRLQLWVH